MRGGGIGCGRGVGEGWDGCGRGWNTAARASPSLCASLGVRRTANGHRAVKAGASGAGDGDENCAVVELKQPGRWLKQCGWQHRGAHIASSFRSPPPTPHTRLTGPPLRYSVHDGVGQAGMEAGTRARAVGRGRASMGRRR